MKDAYKGFSNLLPRSVGILTYYFCVFTSIRRRTKWAENPVGLFFCSGFAATSAWWIMWPFELLKNLA
jgi:solute carrier family 25 carnitine/acylcarnitine transporter 20/29